MLDELVIGVIELLLLEVLIELVDERLVVEVGGGTLLEELVERDPDVVVEMQGKGGAVYVTVLVMSVTFV